MEYKNLEPKEVFYWFEEISKIPRESGNEKEISDFLLKFAQERNLEALQDEALNVIIKKPASKGYENRQTVALQGHMDMVAVKDADSKHDFFKDPIELLVEDGWVTANKTTLGADDGIAVAYSLAILDDDTIEHGPLEVIITTDEERGMTGVNGLDPKNLTAKYLLNLDSEEEGILTVGCSGGLEAIISFKKEYEKSDGEFIKISIGGFEGGHSGMEIDKFRANAIKQIARLIVSLEDYKIGKISGGVKRNAIAAEAEAIIQVENSQQAIEILNKVKEDILHEFRMTDPNGNISIDKFSFTGDVLTKEISKNIAEFLFVAQDGLYKKDLDLNAIVTSSNLGVIEESEDYITVSSLIRSEVYTDKMYRGNMIKKTAEKFGAEVSLEGEYPGWEKEDSSLMETSKKVWKEFTKTEQIIATTHGGLECGILKDRMPDTEMISFGPEIEGAHSPKERVNIKSVETNYLFLKELLKELI